VNIPNLGEVAQGEDGQVWAAPLPVALLGGRPLSFEIWGYAEDDAKEDFHAALAALLRAPAELLDEARPFVYRYYEDTKTLCPVDVSIPNVARADDIWGHVRFGSCLQVGRCDGYPRDVYLSLECECDWEPEHGLQLVFRWRTNSGLQVCKVGPYDGHSTYAHAFGNPTLEDVIYVSPCEGEVADDGR
jgi:hypothetical protein